MKHLLSLLLSFLSALAACAQAEAPCGAYEAAGRPQGLPTQVYLEINLNRPSVPDFSQTFDPAAAYPFRRLPRRFMRKASVAFAGQRAHGFARLRNAALTGNEEDCLLSQPRRTAEGWQLHWQNHAGQSGTCLLRLMPDSTLHIEGLGSLTGVVDISALRYEPSDSLTLMLPHLLPDSADEAQARAWQQVARQAQQVAQTALLNKPHFAGLFRTDREMKPFVLDFTRRFRLHRPDVGTEECHGCIYAYPLGGRRIDEDVVLEAEPQPDNSVRIKYRCERSGNVYTARLVYDPPSRTFTAEEVEMVAAESEMPQFSDCYLSGIRLEWIKPLE